MISRVFVLLISLAAISGPVAAQNERLWKIESDVWSGGAYKEADGRFSHCAVSTLYESGITLAIGLTGSYEIQLILRNDEWELPVGSSYNLPVSVDGRRLGVFNGYATRPGFLLIDAGQDMDVFDTLRTGQELTIDAARESFSFGLDGTAKALDVVRNCVEAASGKAETKANPFAESKPRARLHSNPFEKNDQPVTEEDKLLVRGLLRLSGIEEVEFVEPSTTAFDGARYSWQAGQFYGAVYAGKTRAGDLDQMAAALLAQLDKNCSGIFTSSAPPAEVFGENKLKPFSSACRTPEGRDDFFYAATSIDSGHTVTTFINTTFFAPEKLQHLNQSIAAWFRRMYSE